MDSTTDNKTVNERSHVPSLFQDSCQGNSDLEDEVCNTSTGVEGLTLMAAGDEPTVTVASQKEKKVGGGFT